MITISTESGVVVLLAASLIMIAFTVVGFNKTSKELEMINESVQKTQTIIQEQDRSINRANVNKVIEK